MNEEEKFDELINSKLSEREFPFDEMNWDEAERLIIRQEKWTKIKRVSLIFSAGLALGVGVMLPFVLNNRNVQPTIISQAKTDQNSVSQNNTTPSANQPEKAIVSNDNNGSKRTKDPLPVQSAFVKKNNSTGIRTNSSDVSVVKGKIRKQPIILATSDNKKIHKQHLHTAPKRIVASAVINNNQVANTEIINPEKSNPVTVPIADVNPSPVNNKNIPVDANPSPEKAIAKSNESTPTNTAPTNTSPTKTNAANNDATGNNKSTKNSTANSTANKTATKAAKVKSPKKGNESGGISQNSGRGYTGFKPDSLVPINRMIIPGTDQPYVPVYAANILSVYAGGNYSFGWNNNGTREGSGITPLGGFILTHYFNYKYSASIGIGYSELNKLDKSYTSSVIQYDFGENANVTTVTPMRIYYLAVPFKLQYNITDKSMFSIGLDFLLMLTTASNLTTYQQDLLTQTTPSSTMQNGYTQGFSNFDFQFTGAFTRMLTNRLAIRPEYYFGVNYIENNSFPGINQFERNMGMRLVLSYQLMK